MSPCDIASELSTFTNLLHHPLQLAFLALFIKHCSPG